MDINILIRERNGKDEIWYSEGYVKQQIEIAYRAGVSKGIKVEFHAVIPNNDEMVNDLTNEFKKIVEQECQIAFANNEVWHIS
jgi:hypothetical protein